MVQGTAGAALCSSGCHVLHPAAVNGVPEKGTGKETRRMSQVMEHQDGGDLKDYLIGVNLLGI